MEGKVDQYPESAFMLVGTIEDAIEKGEKILAQITMKLDISSNENRDYHS